MLNMKSGRWSMMWGVKGHLKNKGGILYIGGCSSLELAERYGTPVFITDEGRVRENYRRIRDSFKKFYEKVKVFYSMKANSNLSILRILRQEGSGVDCSSPGEIFLARLAGFTKENILYTGCYNSDEEFRYVCDAEVMVNLDDITHIDRIVRFGMPPIISFRINPGIGKGKFAGIVTAGRKAKFGVMERHAVEAYRRAKDYGFKRFGIHMMTGSGILNQKYFESITEKLLEIAGKVSKRVGVKFEFIDLGGGFGVPYQPGEEELDLEALAKGVTDKFLEKVEKLDLGEPFLFIEPGRYIVCDSTILLARVHSVKVGYRKFVGIDAGMNTLIRPALYKAYHQIYVANKLDENKREKVDICGQICENTDILAQDRELPIVKEGDLIAILNAGAYGFSMSSQYNGRPRAAEVLVSNGVDEIIREREELHDLIGRQRIPARLL